MDPLLLAWGLDRTARFIDDDLRPRSRALTGATVSYSEFLTRNRRTVRNVIGVLKAPGERGREAIVIGAHYDHVGLGGRFSVVPDRTGEIHNGADDNASGTASIIEMAKAAAADPARFPRTLVFVAFAGEERGLLGSAYYANHPVVPLGDTVAMLNLDMVGRLRGSVDVSGLDSAPSLLADLNCCRASGRKPTLQTGRARRGAQRRLAVPRHEGAGDQLLHRLPRRLSPPGRRLAADRRGRYRASGAAGARVRRADRRAANPPRVQAAAAIVARWSVSPLR